MLSTPKVTEKINCAISQIEVDVNNALSIFHEGIKTAGLCMLKEVTFSIKKQNPWFDSDCYDARRTVRHSLRKLQRAHNSNEIALLREIYSSQRKNYKNLLKDKKGEHKLNILKLLETNEKDSKKFWSTVKSVNRKSIPQNDIKAEDWVNHFQSVFNSFVSVPRVMNQCDSNDDYTCSFNETLDCDISIGEVQEAIRFLKSSKAAGPDGVIGEFYKYSNEQVTDFFVKYFNTLFSTGQFPEQWTESIIQPIHKKGDSNLPDNYRGISLLNVSSKLYSYILNKRLTIWAEDNNVINEAQAGFRKNYSTTDHIFTLMSIVQKQLLLPGKLYVAFIDFRKAFDLVEREFLWSVLRSKGIGGRMYRAVKSMYDVVRARVRVGGDLTEAFMCPCGLKQGEICSPILFSLLINELADDVLTNGKHGIALTPDVIEILIMLFADDVILMSYTVVGLQRQLNVLHETSKRLGLQVNLEKSKVVVFRKGGYLAAREKWFYDSIQLEVVNQYKYLGIIFSSGLTFSHALEDIASKAKKGTVVILKLLWQLEDQSLKLFSKLFDSQIQPMVTYGSEVWGVMSDLKHIEKVHLYALKRFLNVSAHTPNFLVYGESGRYPLYINAYCRSIKYWLHVLQLPDDRLPHKAYNMLYRLHNAEKTNWVSRIHDILYKYGFGYVWENQGVNNSKHFIRQFKQRLIDCFLQDWHSKIVSSSRFQFYSSFKSTHCQTQEIFQIKSIAVRKAFIQFRLGVSPIKCHRYRYRPNSPANRNCPFCPGCVENEYHFLLNCPKYSQLRNSTLPIMFITQHSEKKMVSLLATEKYTKVVAFFVYKAFQMRSKALML
jgi:hypothetical protein